MIPITRKEKYINEIVGGGNTAPETPQTREEIFFAGILGEVVAPSPITRIEKYLAKIANKYSGELPEPVTRVERFLAMAAGMNVSIPTPITREEMFWADYALIIEKELSGIPPLTFNAIAGTLKNYRIYGNTVNSESVGDKTENLWGAEIVDNYSSYPNGKISKYDGRCSNIEPIVVDGNSYTLSYLAPSDVSCIVTIKNSGELIKRQFKSGYEIVIDTTGGNELYITWLAGDAIPITSDMIQDVMLNTGSTALLYEPYGYKIPVTLTADSAETADIYLDEPLAKSGNNTDYIDYATQKRHNSDGTESTVTLPEIAVTAGTNTLTAGTEVQPSEVYIKYEGAR